MGTFENHFSGAQPRTKEEERKKASAWGEQLS